MDINSDHIADGTTIPLLVKCYYGVVEYLIGPGYAGVTGLPSSKLSGYWEGVSMYEDSLQVTNKLSLTVTLLWSSDVHL